MRNNLENCETVIISKTLIAQPKFITIASLLPMSNLRSDSLLNNQLDHSLQPTAILHAELRPMSSNINLMRGDVWNTPNQAQWLTVDYVSRPLQCRLAIVSIRQTAQSKNPLSSAQNPSLTSLLDICSLRRVIFFKCVRFHFKSYERQKCLCTCL